MSGASKPRLDELLVMRGLFPNVHDAQVAVLAGEVIVGEHRETSAGKRLKPDVCIRLKNTSRFVSRGGEKLKGALDAFELDVRGLRAVDMGCSTGGFTDCLLKAGAKSVSAVDVGYGQFSWVLRNDSRVALFERTNVRGIDVAFVGGPFELVVGDLSFVSLTSLMPDITRLACDGARLVLLVKPQFELDASCLSEGGIVCDPQDHELAIRKVAASARSCGLSVVDVSYSPVKGTKGNREYLLLAQKPGLQDADSLDINDEKISEVVKASHELL